MELVSTTNKPRWSLPQKLLFRFFFIYFFLFIAPFWWFDLIPGVSFILSFYNQFIDWLTIKANASFFTVFGIKNVQPVSNGSGDTSFNWAQNYLFIALAVIGSVIWSLVDWRRESYRRLNYLLCLIVRYNLILAAFGYGFIKVFCLQMSFPLISQLATPLGDLLPMRFSWLFIGYSTPYQVFSGVMEVLAAALLLWRRTATMGALVATAVFINVMMLNLCYDIPVKLYAMNLVMMCLFLVANEYERIACFFVLNRPALPCSLYQYPYLNKKMRIARIVLKLAIVSVIAKDVYSSWQRSKSSKMEAYVTPVKSGVYDVVTFAVNHDTLAPLIADTIRWQDVIFEKDGVGSLVVGDTLFRKRYGRDYFFYKADTVKHVMAFRTSWNDTVPLFSLNYQMPEKDHILLRGKRQNDSLYVELVKSKREFPLAERQFHWLSEANR